MVKGLDVFAKAMRIQYASDLHRKIGNTHILTNQLGYVFSGEHLSFDHRKYLEI